MDTAQTSGPPGASSQTTPDMCVGHSGVPATGECRACRSATCETCTFVFPGDLRFCPKCVANAETSRTPRRQSALRWAYVHVGISGALLVVLFVSAAVATPIAATVLSEIALRGSLGFAAAGYANAVEATHRLPAPSIFERLPAFVTAGLVGLMLVLTVVGLLMG